MTTEETPQERVGREIVRKREASGLSQLMLAQNAGVDPKTLRGIEQGARWPQGKTRKAIELALGWPEGAMTRIRDGDPAPAASRNPHSPAGILERIVTDHTGGRGASPRQLQEIRRILEEREIEALPERVAQLRPENKIRVNVLVTQLEDEEYQADRELLAEHPEIEEQYRADVSAADDSSPPPEDAANPQGPGQKTGQVRNLADRRRNPESLPEPWAARDLGDEPVGRKIRRRQDEAGELPDPDGPEGGA